MTPESQTQPAAPPSPPAPQFLCPYCGHISHNPQRCDHCKGLFEPLSRQATQNAMGPWQIRSTANPHQPGCSFATLKSLIAKGKVTRTTILRGPTTRQFWSFAANAPAVAVLLGECHSCHNKVKPDEYMCTNCNAVLAPPTDRQSLGLAPVKLLPGQAPAQAVASSSMATARQQQPNHPPQPPRAQPTPRRQQQPTPTQPAPAQSTPRTNDQGRESTRRLRDRLRFMTGAFIVAVILNVAVLITFAVIMLADSSNLRIGTASPDSEPSTTPSQAQPQSPSSTTPAATPDHEQALTDQVPESAPTIPEILTTPTPEEEPQNHDLDPGLDPWTADINLAAQIEQRDTIEDLERAVAILNRVLTEAKVDATDRAIDNPSFPLLQARIDRLNERIDRLSLRDMFD